MKPFKKIIRFTIGLFLFCCGYWVLDSAWSYLSFEKNLSAMIFREPMSYWDPILLKVPPYQVVSRIMVTIIFIVTAVIIFFFYQKHKKDEKEKLLLERQLQQSQKMESIGTLAGGIAHDFNNILYGLIGFTELCIDDAESDTILHDNLVEVLAGAKRAKELVEQILMFSRRTENEKRPVIVGAILEKETKLLRAIIPSTIDIVVDIQAETSTIRGDTTQIHQIIMNLSTNAHHAMEKEGGTLTITLSNEWLGAKSTNKHPAKIAQGAYLKLSVSDTGKGIPRELQDRIFEPFFTSKEQGKGTGMGLSVVHGIVQAHDGFIQMKSAPDKGTTFNVYLPLLLNNDDTLEMNNRNELPVGKEHILIVDDEEQVVSLQRQLLEKLNYTVTPHTNSLQAINTFKVNPAHYDAFITDMTMPNMTGDRLAAEIKKIKPDIPVIMCTGFSKKINDVKAEDIGVDALLIKPVRNEDLARTLRHVLDNPPASI